MWEDRGVIRCLKKILHVVFDPMTRQNKATIVYIPVGRNAT